MSAPDDPAAACPLLSASGLVKSHRNGVVDVPAVRGVTLDIGRGEFVAITGPSGAGKSTLLHLLGGLHRPDQGELRLDGQRVDRLSESQWAVIRRRRYGIVFQSGNLLGDLTVADNVELPALLAGRPPRTARARRTDLLEQLGLADKAGADPGALSGGERQLVALARALVNDPDLLLADEPTGSLDSRSAREVLRLLGGFHDQGRTIVLVTHDARVAGNADRVVSLFDGQVADDARIDEATASGGADSVRRIIELGG
ncbi:ABC transporter ATP-binding protein [Streptacidiphilus sp. PB12-B1b]|uniref:ABC transporter ATP-binding protein n=1 Tax=Streptacidiphilus sp. PB12-B1b TaxID=2705012 RepID=UPI0015F8EE2D|nr:ABC transporter ATP-binding protein [Streptacidiphilus sp. PB12-B1b]QMU77903.1 ABC transporter ATP-binding protein [Streptacidiphilus sp. PB12-B1b]